MKIHSKKRNKCCKNHQNWRKKTKNNVGAYTQSKTHIAKCKNIWIDRDEHQMDGHFVLHFVKRQLISKLTRENGVPFGFFFVFSFILFLTFIPLTPFRVFYYQKQHEHIKPNSSEFYEYCCDAKALKQYYLPKNSKPCVCVW